MGRSKAGFCPTAGSSRGRWERCAPPEAVRCETQHREHSHGSIPACLLGSSRRPPGCSHCVARSFVPSRAPRRPRRSSCGCVRPRSRCHGRRHREPGRWRFPDRAGRAELVPGRGDAEDDHDLARSGDLPASALPQRRERGIAGAGRREPGSSTITTRPAAELGLLMMGHCTAREAAAFFAKTGAMTPSVSTLQRLTLSMHECWESLGPETLGSIREAEGIPQDATTASVSLDGVMVPLRRRGRSRQGLLARGRLRHGLLPRRRGQAPEDPLSRPHAGERQAHAEGAACKRSRTHQASTPRDRDRRYRRWRRRQLDLPGDPVARNRGDRLLACLRHLQTASDHAVAPGWFEKYREILRHDPRGVAKVIRALRHLRDAAAAPDRAETERELAFFRIIAIACATTP